MIDYTTLTTEDFQDHCTALYAEQYRRNKLVTIPQTISDLTAAYVEVTGSTKEELKTAVDVITTEKEARTELVDSSVEPVEEPVKGGK